MSKNDGKILELMALIDKRKAELGSYRRPNMETNGVLHLDGNTYNLHALHDIGKINLLICQLHACIMAAENLKIDPSTLKISGYTLVQWCNDLDDQRIYIERRNAEAELQDYQSKLDAMLSSDKKAELEIDAIAQAISK